MSFMVFYVVLVGRRLTLWERRGCWCEGSDTWVLRLADVEGDSGRL